MVPFPSVPTDSLYKFMALGGVIALLTTFILFITETEKIKSDDISLSNNIEVMNKRIDNLNKTVSEIKTELKQDSAYSSNETKRMRLAIELREKLGFSTMIERNELNPKYSTFDEYKKSLSEKYNNAVELYNKRIVETYKPIESIEFEELNIKKQKALLRQNREYYDNLYYSTYAITLIAILFSGYGFKKWKYLQSMSDELTQLQLEKTRKEVNGEKPKLIMPD